MIFLEGTLFCVELFFLAFILYLLFICLIYVSYYKFLTSVRMIIFSNRHFMAFSYAI
jgi:hypothetical protein